MVRRWVPRPLLSDTGLYLRSTDDGLRPLLHQHLRVLLGSPVDWQAIESAMMGAGIPDSNACWRGREWWVECKATPSRGGYALPSLDAMQVGWHLRRAACGGVTWILTRRHPRQGRGEPPGSPDELWLHRGTDAPRLAAEGLRGPPALLRAAGGPAAWPWETVGLTMVGAVAHLGASLPAEVERY